MSERLSPRWSKRESTTITNDAPSVETGLSSEVTRPRDRLLSRGFQVQRVVDVEYRDDVRIDRDHRRLGFRIDEARNIVAAAAGARLGEESLELLVPEPVQRAARER